MSASFPSGAAASRTSDWYSSHARRTSMVAGALALAFALACTLAIVGTASGTLLAAALVGAAVSLSVLTRPVVGVYLLFGGALLFEQFEIRGLSPITAQTHIFQNLSAYTEIPVRLSIMDLLALLTLGAWAAQCMSRPKDPPRMGAFGWPIVAFAGIFAIGTAIGVARGSGWDPNAFFQEIRGPAQMCLTYFLAANLLRTRGQLVVLTWVFVALVGVKGLQGILNGLESLSRSDLEAVTGHEDVIFFDLAIALLAVILMVGARTGVRYALLAILPLVVGAELLTERRVGFVALGVVLAAIVLLSLARSMRRAVVFGALGSLALCMYLFLFWNDTGPLGQPSRALRAVVEPSNISERDLFSAHWRDIENRNIAYTVRQLPLTGVGVGQEYLFEEEPPSLGSPKFFYWRNITHNSVLWLWLKAGPLGAFVLWFLVARVLLIGSAMYARLRDPELRWLAALPVALMVIQITFVSVEPGFVFSRSMIVLGTVLGLGAALAALEHPVREGRR